MKTRSLSLPVLALVFLYLPLAGLAQESIDMLKKTGKTMKPSLQVTLSSKMLRPVSGKNLPSKAVQNDHLKNSLSNRRNSELVILPKNIRKVNYASETGLPIFIQNLPGNSASLQSTAGDPATACFKYLNSIKSLLKMDHPEDQFAITRIHTDEFAETHIRLNQVYKGIPVYGGDVIVHLNKAGEGESFNGRYFPVSAKINTIPVLQPDAAIGSALSDLYKGSVPVTKEPGLSILVSQEKPESSLVIYRKRDDLSASVLAYHVTIFASDHHRWEYFIDAASGEVINRFDNTCSVDGKRTATAIDLNDATCTMNSYEYGSKFYLIDLSKAMYTSSSFVAPDDLEGAIFTLDMQNTYGNNQAFYYVTSSGNIWSDPTAVSAHYNAGMAYDYYYNVHGRNSIDGKGGNIISIINVPDNETGGPLDNAYWNGRYMFYGNGDQAFTPLAGGLDVGGHEMTHGVVENTANLEYQGESGAINESMADVFGTMIENDDWLIGEDVVVRDYFPSGALRSMSDPHNGGTSLNDNGYQPKYVDEKYTGSQDNYGVHINSGICNYAFYLFAQAIGKEEAAAVYYKALDDYLTKSSQFIDLRLAIIQSATELYGEDSDPVTQAGIAFDAVGIMDGQGTEVDPTLPENPGDEYLLVYNTEYGDENTIYRSNLEGTEYEPLTTTPSHSRPNVSDNGEWAVFVSDDDSTLHGIITLPGYAPDESIIQSQHMWSNAVLSKDGNRIAGVSAWADATIWVYDYVTEEWHDFALYNPTYTQGVEGSGVQYADALEFDYSGEFLVYDAFNSNDNGDGNKVEYWDVNFIKVWDNETGSFGDGKIYKLFSSIPEGVSIGNPTFSKNSTNILAFDYWNSVSDEYAILGLNIEDNVVTTLVENNMIGWPSFNKTDSRIAFTSALGDNYEINYINFNKEQLYSDGIVHTMFTGGAWPVYYSIGDRLTGFIKTTKHQATQEIVSYPNPFRDHITLTIPGNRTRKCTVEILNQTGQVVYSGNYTVTDNNILALDLARLASGYYFVRLTNENNVFSGKIIKTE
jgi:bacillolysin